MKDSSVLDIMVAQHALVEALFFAFRDESKDNTAKAQPFLADFVWELEKHFLVEEGAIFSFLPWKDPEISEMISRVKDEHVTMLESLASITKKMPKVEKEEIEGFFALLSKHRQLEEEKLYPLLDQRLNDIQKKQIIARVNQISINPMG